MSAAGRVASPLLQGAVAAGYARALQDRTRREQERISASAFAARAAAEQARWDSEARFRTVFAEAVIGIGLGRHRQDRSSRSTTRWPTCSATPRTRCRGEPIWTFVHPDDVPGLWERTKELLAGERNHLRVEKAYYRPDGSEVWTDLVAVADPRSGRQPRSTWSR